MKKLLALLPLTLLYLPIGHTQPHPDQFKELTWKPIAPANMGGRVTDMDGEVGDPATFYVSGADGGVFKTSNGGTTFSSLFTDQRVYSVGALTVAPSDPNYFGSAARKVILEIVWGMATEFIDHLMPENPGNTLAWKVPKG